MRGDVSRRPAALGGRPAFRPISRHAASSAHTIAAATPPSPAMPRVAGVADVCLLPSRSAGLACAPALSLALAEQPPAPTPTSLLDGTIWSSALAFSDEMTASPGQSDSPVTEVAATLDTVRAYAGFERACSDRRSCKRGGASHSPETNNETRATGVPDPGGKQRRWRAWAQTSALLESDKSGHPTRGSAVAALSQAGDPAVDFRFRTRRT